MKNFKGLIFSKLSAIGTKSEGPAYFLQQVDYSELKIQKTTPAWEADPTLHQFIARKVVISGNLVDNYLCYDKIIEANSEKFPWVNIYLNLKGNTLWVNKMPPIPDIPTSPKGVQVGLYVQWPYTTPWHGTCPTSQIFDLEILPPTGKSLWKWSKGKKFKKQETEVALEGMIQHEFTAEWTYFEKEIPVEGTYTLVGTFFPTQSEVRKEFQVKFAR